MDWIHCIDTGFMYSIIGEHLKLVLADEPQIRHSPATSGMGRFAALIYSSSAESGELRSTSLNGESGGWSEGR